jgi:hypothetical protein
MYWGSTQSHSFPRGHWRMISMQARDVEHSTCDNVDSLCHQVGYADEKRVEEDAFVECL